MTTPREKPSIRWRGPWALDSPEARQLTDWPGRAMPTQQISPRQTSATVSISASPD